MYLLLVLLPLIGSLFAGFFGRYLGYRGAGLFSSTCVGLSAIASWIAFYEVGLSGSPCYIKLAPWFHSEFFDASWGFLFDSLSVVMLVTVTTASTCIHLYSISYMGEDPHLPRFMSYLSIFTFFMLVLVTADNFIQMFLGWEGIGLASYLLINFWVTRLQANKAALKAMLVNKIGDFGLALGILGIFQLLKTVDYASLFACVPYISESSICFFQWELDGLTLIGGLIFLGVVGKSSQIGLHTWLPDAMEGPTPVSALIHAATLVTAGVFLMARVSPLLEYAPQALSLIAFTGAMTCFLAASTGIMQNDLKRVIAYSTCSQLGYMVFACGLSSYGVSIFHLMNHAFFKALLFLSAGSLIHALGDEQDMRKMGGLGRLLPYTYGMILIGSLSLAGFPFLTGFYSKDVILEMAYAKYSLSGNFAYWLGALSVFFTSYYSFRLISLAFFAPTNAIKTSIRGVHDAPFLLGAPLIPLALGSLFLGFLGKDMMIGAGSTFWGNALFILPQNSLSIESEWIPQNVKLLPLILTIGGAITAYFINLVWIESAFRIKTHWLGREIYLFLNKRWLFDKVYNEFIAKVFMQFGYHISFKSLDKGAFEVVGPYGIIQTVPILLKEISRFQSGFLYHYALIMLIGITFLIGLIGLGPLLSYWIDPRLYFVFLSSFLFFILFNPRRT
uniref:NADH-ubiquinone oxidoreductase chain 5 n=1 Tax=Pyramimonas parkeae TaxID=36894 RepID=A0A1D8I1S7_9CHLO|nr:NADH dehydrogenase subunit 5 [Pyramimonas parkeae]AOT98925.1 NADH dehydrogenase subunit 5 [Pyramimonas parkeae]